MKVLCCGSDECHMDNSYTRDSVIFGVIVIFMWYLREYCCVMISSVLYENCEVLTV